MKKHINLHSIIAFFFTLLFALPGIIFLFSEKKDFSQVEKRRLASFPEISWQRKSLEEFPKKFEKYLQDHFGFRSQIVRAHNYIFCKIFHASATEPVIVGQKNWYYLNSDGSIGDYLGFFQYDDTALKEMETVLSNRKKWLQSQNIHYLFLPIPNKEMIYNEFYPKRFQKHKGINKYSQILGFIKKNGEFTDYIDVKDLMLKNKREQELYYHTDSHWNNYGSFVLYQEIIKRIQKWFPEMSALPKTVGVNKEVAENSGDLAIMMNLQGILTENLVEQQIEMKCNAEKEPMFSIREMKEYSTFADHELPTTLFCPEGKRTAIIIHDSFGDSLLPYLLQNFRQIISINYMNFEKAKPLIAKISPDIVIDLRVARNIEKALYPDPELQRLVDELER